MSKEWAMLMTGLLVAVGVGLGKLVAGFIRLWHRCKTMLVLALMLVALCSSAALRPVKVKAKAFDCGQCSTRAVEQWQTAMAVCQLHDTPFAICRSLACYVQQQYVSDNCPECEGMIPTCD